MVHAVETVLLRRVRGRIARPALERAGEAIRGGGVVVFPTETVYGLGANALDESAVRRIFLIKGRPADNPIIVHVADKGQVRELASVIPRSAVRLMDAFWPGPLTLVLRKKPVVPDVVTAGLDTVSIRMPDNRTALGLIRCAGTPIAAPSANLSGRPSITSLSEAVEELDGRVDFIIDGGPSEIGMESTVVDMTVKPPRILRPGGLTAEKLKRVVGNIAIHPATKGTVGYRGRTPSPGMKYRHYAPVNAKVVLFEKGSRAGSAMARLRDRLTASGHTVALLVTDEARVGKGIVVRLGSRKNPDRIARGLYSALRKLDRSGIEFILAEGIEESGIGLAVMNRLRRASGGAGPEDVVDALTAKAVRGSRPAVRRRPARQDR